MLNLNISGIPEKLLPGIAAFTRKYAAELDGTVSAEVTYTERKELSLARSGNTCRISVHEDVHIFRALSKLIMNFSDESYSFSENAYFDFNGPMFDFGQAAAFLTVERVKFLLLAFAAVGFNAFMIYTEDCLTVDGEPYFGYRRPKYTFDELREIDDFAYSLGIEVIPCVQTLSHLPGLMRHGKYRVISDDDATLLVGDGRTYELIEKIIVSALKPLRTKKIHIGLDEAWRLGQGRYLIKNGFRPKAEIFAAHVERVREITDRLGVYAFMWDDMYFRASSPTNEYYIPLDKEPDIENGMHPPKNMGYVYWDYYHGYDYVKPTAEKHLRMFGDVFFAGAAVNTYGVGYMREFTVRFGDESLRACKDAGIRKIMCTVWGDDARESPPYAVLPGVIMYAEHGYSEAPTEKQIKEMFEFAVGAAVFDDVNAISTVDIIPGYSDLDGNIDRYSPARQALYQNVLLGLFDKNFESYDLSAHFSLFTKKMTDAKMRTPESSPFYGMFDFYEKLGAFLSLKGDLGIRIRRAYKCNDRSALAELSEKVIPEAIGRAELLHSAFRRFFFDNYKPWGFEIFDIRLGGVSGSLITAKYRIDAYLSGTGELSELDEEPLLFNGKERLGSTVYADIATASIISKVL